MFNKEHQNVREKQYYKNAAVSSYTKIEQFLSPLQYFADT